MLKSKIKTHKSGTIYKQPHFFILNKGLNSGKPFRHYVCNSFVFLADDKDERDFYYFMLLGIWELRLLRPYLKGSVIEYVRLGDVGDFLAQNIESNSKLSFVSAYFTIYAYEKLRNQLDSINLL